MGKAPRQFFFYPLMSQVCFTQGEGESGVSNGLAKWHSKDRGVWETPNWGEDNDACWLVFCIWVDWCSYARSAWHQYGRTVSSWKCNWSVLTSRLLHYSEIKGFLSKVCDQKQLNMERKQAWTGWTFIFGKWTSFLNKTFSNALHWSWSTIDPKVIRISCWFPRKQWLDVALRWIWTEDRKCYNCFHTCKKRFKKHKENFDKKNLWLTVRW